MSYYETPAEKPYYIHFQKRTVDDTLGHFHSGMELIIVKSGSLVAVTGDEKRTLGPGDVCFSDSFRVHSYSGTKDLTVYAVICDKVYFSRFHTLTKGRTLPSFFRVEDTELIERLFAAYNGSACPKLTFEGALDLMLAEFMKSAPLVPRRKNPDEAVICKILRYIEDNLEDKISLEVLSQKFGYSKEYISRLFSKNIGTGTKNYVNELRARRAEQLLQSRKDKNVIDIALACGFESSNTFYRAYKKYYGRLPRRG